MNVILVAVDTLRSQSMSCYGYDKPTCPNIERFAAEGVLFENSMSVVHNTHPAFTTLATGCYPITHRVVRMNGNYHLEERRFRFMPELFAEAGFRTLAVDDLTQTGGMVHATWMAHGFDEYHLYRSEPGHGRVKRRLFRLNPTVFDLLDQNKDRPFFLFVHCWDTHGPYLPREKFARRFHDGPDFDERFANTAGTSVGDVEAAPTGRTRSGHSRPDPGWVRFMRGLYDGCVAEMDDAFGDLMGKLDELGLADDTLVCLTADHGEDHGEHNCYFSHRGCYQDSIGVPIIFRWPGGLPAGKRLAGMAQQTDVTATLLSLAGIEPDAAMEGVDLGPAMRGETEETYEYAHAHSTLPDARRAIRDKRYKYIEWVPGCPREPETPERELYDLRADPLETTNLVDEQPAVADRMKTELARWVEEKLANTERVFGSRRGDPLVEQAWQGHLPYDGTPRWFRHDRTPDVTFF